MNKTLVIYYTRTNTSVKVADYINTLIDCDVISLTDNINWKGLFGFLHGGKKSSKLEKVEYNPINSDLDSYEHIILISPIWANRMTPTFRSFIEDNLTVLQNKSSMIFHAAGRVGDKAIPDLHSYLPNAKTLSIVRKDFKSNNYQQLITDYIKPSLL